MSDGMRRELVYLSSHATNRYFIPNWGIFLFFSVYSFETCVQTWSAIVYHFALFYIKGAYHNGTFKYETIDL